MGLAMKSLVSLVFWVLSVSVALFQPASADDTDIYRSLYDIEGRGGKPQVMIIFDTSGSMEDYVADTNGGLNEKIIIAKRVITDLIEQNPQVDFGLSVFNYNFPDPDGGRVVAALPGEGGVQSDDARSSLVKAIDGLGGYTSTPLCEAYYEVYRYFNGNHPWHGKDDRYQQRTGGWWWGEEELVDANPPYTEAAFDGAKYRSPLRPCEPIYVIYMTDGLPQNDTDANTAIRSNILTNEFNDLRCRGYPDADGRKKENCMPELAYVMHQSDTFTTTNDGGRREEKGPVTTYTIGFDTDQQLLVDTASPLNISGDDCPVPRHDTRYNGRNACVGYFTANDADQLQSAFQGAIDDILSRSTTFSAPAVSSAFTNNTQSFDRLYLPRFLPRNEPRWSGNVKRLRFVSQQSWEDEKGSEAFNASTGDIQDTAWTWWSGKLGLDEPDGNMVEMGGVGGLLRQSVNKVGGAGRTIYTDDGRGLVNFDAGTSWGGDPTNWGLPEESSKEEIDELVAWARGWDVDDEDDDGVTQEARPWIMGDILHSDPIALNYGGKTQDQEKLYLAFGTNAGFLHFVDGDSGQEQWAFTPKSLAPLHNILRKNDVETSDDDTLTHPYGIDGPASYVRVDGDRDGRITRGLDDHMILAFGMRRGGRDYYALDVTNPAAPSLAWEITPETDSKFSKMGQSWAAPIPAKVPGHSNPVFIISGGYDPVRDDPSLDSSTHDTQGRAIYIVDAITGSLVYKADHSEAGKFVGGDVFQHPIPAAAKAVDSNSDGITDRVYLADTGGDLWRLELDSDNPDDWQVRKVASLGGSGENNRRFFNTIDFVSLESGGRLIDLLLIGSGDRTNPKAGGEGSDLTAVKDAFFAIRDPGSDKTGPVTVDDLENVTNQLMCQRDSDDDTTSCSQVWEDSAGWMLYLDGAYSMSLPGAKVLSQSVTLDGAIYFSAYVPDQPESICVPVIGRSYLFGLDLLTVNSSSRLEEDADLNKGERAEEAGEYLLSRPALLADGGELFLQGIGTANLGQLVKKQGGGGGIVLPSRAERTYWYEKKAE